MSSTRFLIKKLVPFVAPLLIVVACNPVTRHKVVSTIFDGVPSLPPADEMCRDYKPLKNETVQLAAVVSASEEKLEGSTHPPYAEKKCSSCHSTIKDQNSGLIQPKEKLCFLCHPDILQGDFAHGPAAVGDCLGCHLPHNSSNAKLLTAAGDGICVKCHEEARLTPSMHNRSREKAISCPDCHNPHSSNARYFLR